MTKKKQQKIKQVLIGHVGVDSGQILITDPCYIKSEWEQESKPKRGLHPYSYEGACAATSSKKGGGALCYKLGHEGAGVVAHSGYGDGFYPVYAIMDGNVVTTVIIEFMMDFDENE